MLTNEAAAAAELYAELSRRMDEKAFFPRAEQLRALQRDAHEAAGNTAAAFEVTMRLLLDRYDAGQHLSSETARAETLAEALGSPAADVARVGAALADWFEHGYDLAPVTTALETIVAADDPLAGRLVLAVAEQIVTDDDSTDDPEPLCTVASNLVDRLTGTLRTRLECCIADLTVRTDLYDQASLHPLSRFRVNIGSEHLPADCLCAVALVASTNDEAAAVEQRLLPALVAAVTDPTDAELRGRTAVTLNRLRALPVAALAAHPAPAIRHAALACWASQADRDPCWP